MLPDTGIDYVKNQRNADYAKHINDPVLSSLKMEGVRLLFFAYLVSALGVRPLWHGRRQVDNPFPPIPAAAGQIDFRNGSENSSSQLRQIPWYKI
jgi:hypothetical protein